MAWLFIGFWLLITGRLVSMLGVIAEVATFLAVLGLVYVGIGLLTKRTRAGRE